MNPPAEARPASPLFWIWYAWSQVAGVLMIALGLTWFLLETVLPDENQPVVIATQVKLLTPRVPVGGDFKFEVWRESTESCPGSGVVAFTRMGGEGPTAIISARYPLGSPGFNSPPPLVVTREIPRAVGPGKWNVRTWVDSTCPTRNRYDPTGEFEIEVYEP